MRFYCPDAHSIYFSLNYISSFREICMRLASVGFYSQITIECKQSQLFRLLLSCSICGCVLLENMSVVPQGIFAAKKVRENEEKLSKNNEVCDLSPTKYSSKYMNSIWGMYNRYSVHNLKQNMDESVFAFVGQQKETVGPKQSVEKNSTDLKGSLSSSAKNFLSAPGLL